MTDKEEGCRCNKCWDIHREFIDHFNMWPRMTHEQGQALKRRREENEASWQRVMEG